MYIAHFEDNPSTLHLRRSHAEDHAAFLVQHGGTIAGETHRFCDDLGNPYGAMWLINTTDRRVALSLCHADPYWGRGRAQGRDAGALDAVALRPAGRPRLELTRSRNSLCAL